VGSAGEAVEKTSVFVLKKIKIKTKQTTGGSRENIDSYNEYRVNE